MSNERIIREDVKAYLKNKYPTSYIREEFTSNVLTTRNDVFCVSDKHVISVEIKSDKDNLKRLASQVIEYKTYSNLVIVVLDEAHKIKFLRDFSETDLFRGVQVMFYTTKLEAYKRGTSSKYPFLYPLLWSTELKLFTTNLKGRSKIGASEIELREMIENIFTYKEIHDISRHLFVQRIDLTSQILGARFQPFLQDELIEEIIQNKQQHFTNYIEG